MQAPIPTTKRVQRVPVPLGKGERVYPFSVVRVPARTSKGLTDLLVLNLVLLDAASPSKKSFWIARRTIQLWQAKARLGKKIREGGEAAFSLHYFWTNLKTSSFFFSKFPIDNSVFSVFLSNGRAKSFPLVYRT